jgi:tetratricopeptide (TPR) repeat protein
MWRCPNPVTDEEVEKLDSLLDEIGSLRDAGRIEDALTLNEELIRRYDSSPPEDRPLVALNARLRKVDLLRTLARSDEAIAVCDEVVERFGACATPSARWRVARSLDDKAELLLAAGKLEQGVEALIELDTRFADDTNPDRRMAATLAWGLDAKAGVLERLGNIEAAHGADDELIARYGCDTNGGAAYHVARALSRRAEHLQAGGRAEEALGTWDDVFRHSDRSENAELKKLRGRALSEKLELLGLLGRKDEMASLADQMVAAADLGDALGERQLAQGLSVRAALLVDGGRYEDGIEVIDWLARRFAGSTDSAIRRQLMQSAMNKALALSRLGRDYETEAVQQDLLERFGEEALELAGEHAGHAAAVEGHEAELQRVASLYSRAWFLHNLGRREEAIVVLNGILDNDAEEPDDERLGEVIEAVRELREEIEREETDG